VSLVKRLLRGVPDPERLDDEAFVDLAYRFLLGRASDEAGRRHFLGRLRAGAISRDIFLRTLVDSQEFARTRLYTNLGTSIHEGRGRFVRSLPRAGRIVDLGGSCQASARGAFVELGYPYRFERLTIVDLPDGERHELYRSDGAPAAGVVETDLGPVDYLYQSMITLHPIPDASVDLVYAGQSIEHVTRPEAATAYREVWRVLRPAGFFALDTPNARVTRLQQDDFIDPDHEHEYTHGELSRDLTEAGFEIVEAKGINHAGSLTSRAQFSEEAVARACGLFSELEDCYVLAYVCRKPERAS